MPSDEIGIAMLGSGFIGEFHTLGLRHAANARVVANYGRGAERREAFAARFGTRAYDSIEGTCSDPDVDLVVVSLPNHLHLDGVRAAAQHGQAVACTKPLGRNAREAGEMLGLVQEAGVFHAYLENVVFNAEMVRMREMVGAGAIGRPTTVRAREGHSGPHAPHFWNAELAGGGALLDMASHGTEAARYMFGKDAVARDVFAWGATLVHRDRTTGEDNGMMLVRFDDERVAMMDVSWSSRGGLEGRFEVYGDAGRMIYDMSATAIRAFIERPAGYIGEKADADTGWVFPVPDETHAHGHDAMMQEVVSAFREGRQPRETFRDGYVVNAILDAAYRSIRSGRWEEVETDAQLLAAAPSGDH
ncbi:MAG: Gfo/Idh/MocA family oxidoreductase [Chloroflexota bacterium]|nr:Gfo/Idh/MocA family oxidoreductase [Chloroflexota bacterium]